MNRISKQNITKVLSVGIMLMGFVHIGATFTPLIADKLTLLPDGTNDAFTYFSLMCGALLILAGGLLYTLAEQIVEYPFVRKPYILTLVILNTDGLLAVCYMPQNPFAWVILVQTIGLIIPFAISRQKLSRRAELLL